MKVSLTLLIALASVEAAQRCLLCAPFGYYAKHPPWERRDQVTPRSWLTPWERRRSSTQEPTPSSSTPSAEAADTTTTEEPEITTQIVVDDGVVNSDTGRGKKTPGLRMKGTRHRAGLRLENEISQSSSQVIPGSPRQLYEACERTMAKRGRYEQEGHGTGSQEPQAGPSGEPYVLDPQVQFRSRPAGSAPSRACKGHDCPGCSEPGPRCAVRDWSDSEDEGYRAAMDEEDEEDLVVYGPPHELDLPLSPGQLALDHRVCEAVLSRGCCNECPLGTCNCGLDARCEQYLSNGFERFREYLTRYKKYLRVKPKAPPVELYGPYDNNDPEVTTPPPPGGSASLALAGAAAAVNLCRFGVHRLPRRSLLDCTPQHVQIDASRPPSRAVPGPVPTRGAARRNTNPRSKDASGYKVWPRKRYGFGIYGR